MASRKPDFCGWATKNDIRCSDGVTIRRDAFKDCDGTVVPLVWNHQHNNPENVLGHALLKNHPNGVRAFAFFNNTPNGQNGKELVSHGDIVALSIFANNVMKSGSDVIHGVIREVSLVLAGANKGALIDPVLEHGEESGEAAVIYCNQPIEIYHSADDDFAFDSESDNSIKHSDNKEESTVATNKTENSDKTVEEVYDSLNDDQKKLLELFVGKAYEEASKEEIKHGEDIDTMKYNAFEGEHKNNNDVISHDEINAAIKDAKKYGSMRDSFNEHGIVISHADSSIDYGREGYGDYGYGISNVGMLFPEYKSMNTPPEFVKRDTSWVAKVMGSVHHTPFSRIKSMFADLTEDAARAKGYITGKMKKEEVFSLLKRSTDAQTIYKKQKIDRNNVIEITDFNVVSWIKGEMRMMLDEEIARAILIGDGRLASDDDHISEEHIRPIWKDDDFFTVKVKYTPASGVTENQRAKNLVRMIKKNRKKYKGSGNPVMYTTEDVLTDMLLIEDENGREIYDTVDKLATALRVSAIVTVPVMEDQTRKDGETTLQLMALIVNLTDYNVGTNKGGEINMFDDFDIDYNQYKYLIETNMSGALTKPYSALAIEMEVSEPTSSVIPAA